MPSKKKPAATRPEALRESRTVDPFFNTPLQFVEISAGFWQVRGHGWQSVKPFLTEAAARHWFSHNMGVPPTFANPEAVTVKSVSQAHEEADVAANKALAAGEKAGAEALEILHGKGQ